MKTKLQLVICMIVCSISVNSCKEKFECSTNNNVPIPQIMKDYFYYKEGTWWVYKNTKNNTYDSMWVSQSSSNNYRGEGGEGFGRTDKCYEHTVMGIDNINTKGFMRWDLTNFVLNNNQRFGFSAFWRDTTTTAAKDLTLFFTENNLENWNPTRLISSEFKDSTILQNLIYKKLIEVKGSDNIVYWLFAKNIGLLKYIDRDSNHWELLKHKTIQ